MRKVICGDSLEKLKQFPDNFVDAVVTDPPYGLKFMNKHWDYSVPSVELWKEVLRVLKPGGHVLSFGGTRTYHRMVVNIEDAGFEIRDCIQWIYGSGFPKSMDISKALDKDAGMGRTETKGVRVNTYDGAHRNPQNHKSPAELSNIGKWGLDKTPHGVVDMLPASDLAKHWDGWGTALKPANEPIVLARKPLIGTVVENILEHGVGGINIDACRIAHDEKQVSCKRGTRDATWNDDNCGFHNVGNTIASASSKGRFPANVILDEEAGRVLDEQTGILKSGDSKGFKGDYSAQVFGKYANNQIDPNTIYADTGGASRFFYCAKASKAERNMGLEGRTPTKVNDGRTAIIDNAFQRGETQRLNTHPTVKPVKLMEYLIKLITPPDGIVLDPFAGSMTTGIACIKQKKSFIMIERDDENYEIGRARLKGYLQKIK